MASVSPGQSKSRDVEKQDTAGAARGLRRDSSGPEHPRSAQAEHHLRHDGHRDLWRALRADVDADRAMHARDLVVGEAGILQALRALGMGPLGAQRADVEAV